MKKYALYSLLMLLLVSCDDGRVEEKYSDVVEGRSVHLTAVVNGEETWPKGYDLALAGFRADDEYAAAVRLLRPADDGVVDVTLTALPAEITSLELCIVNTLHQRVVTFAKLEGKDINASNHIEFEAGNANVAMFNAVQTEFFDRRCISCHGGSTTAARGLYLTAGQSYAHLVGVESKRMPGQLLVAPGSTKNSVLYQVVTTDVSATWGQSHTDMLNPEKDERLVNLLFDWINAGAEE